MPSDDKAAEMLARFPGPVTLYPSRKKWLLVFLGGAVFTAGGIMMIRSGESGGWYVTVFFGLVAITAIVVMLPRAGRLTLDRDSFEANTLFRATALAGPIRVALKRRPFILETSISWSTTT